MASSRQEIKLKNEVENKKKLTNTCVCSFEENNKNVNIKLLGNFHNITPSNDNKKEENTIENIKEKIIRKCKIDDINNIKNSNSSGNKKEEKNILKYFNINCSKQKSNEIKKKEKKKSSKLRNQYITPDVSMSSNEKINYYINKEVNKKMNKLNDIENVSCSSYKCFNEQINDKKKEDTEILTNCCNETNVLNGKNVKDCNKLCNKVNDDNQSLNNTNPCNYDIKKNNVENNNMYDNSYVHIKEMGNVKSNYSLKKIIEYNDEQLKNIFNKNKEDDTDSKGQHNSDNCCDKYLETFYNMENQDLCKNSKCNNLKNHNINIDINIHMNSSINVNCNSYNKNSIKINEVDDSMPPSEHNTLCYDEERKKHRFKENDSENNNITKKKSFDEKEWVQINESYNFWDSLKNNLRNVFLIKKMEDDSNIKKDDEVKMNDDETKKDKSRENVLCGLEKDNKMRSQTKSVSNNNKSVDNNNNKCVENNNYQCVDKNNNKCVDNNNNECVDNNNNKSVENNNNQCVDNNKNVYNNRASCDERSFPFPVDVYVKCLHFLKLETILKCELLNKMSCDIINNRVGVFTYIRKLNLDEKWSSIPIYKRQFYLHQMRNIRHLTTSEKIYVENGMYIHEVAAIIYQNLSSLKTIELLSPEYFMNDNTPRHEPFSLYPSVFEKLEKLTIIGCQTLEWLHIFRNCSFPLLKKFEVCYYPLHHDHWYWNFVFDFTQLGLQGLYKILYTMENLQKLIIGFDVWFDNLEGHIYNPLESHRNELQEYRIINNNRNERYNNISSLSIPPANGYPSRIFKSYRGKLCEEDYSDIFTIAYYMSGKCGKLTRIMIKYRDSYEYYDDEIGKDEVVNELISEASNTASTYYNYVLNWFRSADEIVPRAS
ncbi:hypothetical protein PFBG_05814 [Plasmodium falciparum 7G8]|uniref:Prespore-specific protein n=1 Tax=Plasmodium falciparum (isolate 7G8) TaxID=57266 RepID=W7F3H0_PLAF8|nr:hypothetical protein PFBG_05814 [Plasmodium falciparum 7G8]